MLREELPDLVVIRRHCRHAIGEWMAQKGSFDILQGHYWRQFWRDQDRVFLFDH